ncbi:MAG: hypothetical protein M3041_00210 [Acidobacteriota bacterium]|nr:hypothetical protein [Acidobacteriota bacterium]
MSDVLWIAAVIFLAFPGAIVWRLRSIRSLDLPARLSIALATGIAIVVAILYLYNFVHVPWTRTTVGVPLLGIGVWALFNRVERSESRFAISTALIAIFVALTIYGVATARETCGDLIYFWGPKGQHFHYAGSIDANFLGFRDYYLMHSDYPPLLPLLYAWASLMAHRFSWWGALFLMPIFLAATAFSFRGITRKGWYAFLLTAILGYGFAIGMVGGAADPLLLLLEVIALAALTFDLEILAAVMLPAVALTKVEGAVFVAMTAFAYLITRRKLLKSILIPLPAAVFLSTWIFFASRNHLIDAYGMARGSLHLDLLGNVTGATLRQASYNVFYVPWLATLLPLAMGRNRRRALLPLIVAIGTIASTLFYYLHAASPSWWIEASAQRVLLTPLACLVVAAAAASE